MAGRQEHFVCPTCEGSGRLIVARAAVIGGRIGTAGVNEPCKDCKGRGHLVYEVEVSDEPDAPESGNAP